MTQHADRNGFAKRQTNGHGRGAMKPPKTSAERFRSHLARTDKHSPGRSSGSGFFVVPGLPETRSTPGGASDRYSSGQTRVKTAHTAARPRRHLTAFPFHPTCYSRTPEARSAYPLVAGESRRFAGTRASVGTRLKDAAKRAAKGNGKSVNG